MLVSLRQTIATPATPLIETIQSVVSTMRMLNALHPAKTRNEVIDHNEDEIHDKAVMSSELTTTVDSDHDAVVESVEDTVSVSQTPGLTEEKKVFSVLLPLMHILF